MGIGATIKNVLSSDDSTSTKSGNTINTNTKQSGLGHNRGVSDASGYSSSSQEPMSPDSAHHNNKLPAGTGIGTMGTGATSQGAGPGRTTGTSHSNAGVAGAGGVGAAAANAVHNATSRDHQSNVGRNPAENTELVAGDRTGDFGEPHRHGHNKNPIKALHIPGTAEHDTNQLQHVTHENVRHVETEEVTRQKEHDRHVHHVKHHVQPVIHKEVRDEQHHEMVHPVTKVRETHASKDEDTTLLNSQIKQHKDTQVHAGKERTVIDKGTIVNENVHHHVHHVVQPIIEKETVDRHRIHTVIPSHEVTHEAPVIHESEAHAPVTMDAFTKAGGSFGKNAVGHHEIGDRVLNNGKCERSVEGVGEKIASELHLGNAAPGDHEKNNGLTGGRKL